MQPLTSLYCVSLMNATAYSVRNNSCISIKPLQFSLIKTENTHYVKYKLRVVLNVAQLKVILC